jgi:hypothetical protein
MPHLRWWGRNSGPRSVTPSERCTFAPFDGPAHTNGFEEAAMAESRCDKPHRITIRYQRDKCTKCSITSPRQAYPRRAIPRREWPFNFA